jgi:Fe-S oxidoreductase
MPNDPQKPIAYKPTDALSYDPTEERYWQPAALATEVQRTFEICHGCRMCFKYCDAFPSLFKAIDERHDGDVHKLTAPEKQTVMDDCFQCKLCEVQCPYTPREHHEFQLDFPALVHRWKAHARRSRRPRLRDRVLANPDATGAFARLSFGMANAANRLKPVRRLMERVLGVHRDKLLPPFARRSFEQWARREGRTDGAPGGEAVLFQTCYVQHNEPQLGVDTIEVLEKSGVDVRCAAGLVCCGMPAWERGDLEALQRQAAANLRVLLPFVERGAKVIAINPTCSMMMRREHPRLVAAADRQAAERLAAAVVDPSEFLWAIRNEPRFSAAFRSSPGGTVAYHAPCHLRAQGIGFKGRDLLRKLPGVDVAASLLECCGHDGTIAMTVEGFEPAARIGRKAFDGMQAAEAKLWATDCPLAALQFEQHTGVRPLHPMTILARAYRGEDWK